LVRALCFDIGQTTSLAMYICSVCHKCHTVLPTPNCSTHPTSYVQQVVQGLYFDFSEMPLPLDSSKLLISTGAEMWTLLSLRKFRRPIFSKT
jgi:hypothetical protein